MHHQHSVASDIVQGVSVPECDFVRAPPGRTAAVVLPLKKWKRRFERGTPAYALTWKTAAQRSQRLFKWRCAFMAKYSTSARVLRIGWLIEGLCLKEGYAFPTDSYISAMLDIKLNHVQEALADMERDGAIIRASVFVEGKPQRRIWPSTKIIPPTAGGMDTPHGGTQDTPHRGGTDSLRKAPTLKSGRMSYTQQAARLDAERREEAEKRRDKPT